MNNSKKYKYYYTQSHERPEIKYLDLLIENTELWTIAQFDGVKMTYDPHAEYEHSWQINAFKKQMISEQK